MTSSAATTTHDTQLKSYQKRLKDDIKSLTDNFEHIIRAVKVDPEVNMSAARLQETTYEMRVRAANMTRAAESIMKLIWDIKQYLIINDFPLINETISQKAEYGKVMDIDSKLMHLRDEISNELYDLEDEYYNSLVKMTSQPQQPITTAAVATSTTGSSTTTITNGHHHGGTTTNGHHPTTQSS